MPSELERFTFPFPYSLQTHTLQLLQPLPRASNDPDSAQKATLTPVGRLISEPPAGFSGRCRQGGKEKCEAAGTSLCAEPLGGLRSGKAGKRMCEVESWGAPPITQTTPATFPSTFLTSSCAIRRQAGFFDPGQVFPQGFRGPPRCPTYVSSHIYFGYTLQ